MCEYGTQGVMRPFGRFRHPLVAVTAIALALELLLSVLSMIYDTAYWALVIDNIESGNGLYGLDGYYYGPVWGYVLGLMNAFQNAFLSLGDPVTYVPELAYMGPSSGHQTTAVISSLAFGYLVKTPLIVCTVVLGYATYALVKEVTGDRGKALLAYALVMFSPTVLGSTCIIGMPDVLSAAFMMLSILHVLRGRNFLSGACLMVSFLTKFFPVALVFTIAPFILARNAGDRRAAAMGVLSFAAGATAVFTAMMFPEIMEGTVAESFRYLTDRIGAGGGNGIGVSAAGAVRILVYAAVAAVAVKLSCIVYRGGTSSDTFLKTSSLMMGMCMLFPPAPQYVVVFVPLLSFCVSLYGGRYMTAWKLVAAGSAVVFAVSLCTHLMPLSVSTGIIGLGSLTHFFDVWNAGPGVFTVWNAEFVIGAAVQYAGIVLGVILLAPEVLRRYADGIVTALARMRTS